MFRDRTSLHSDFKTRDKLEKIREYHGYPSITSILRMLADKELKRLERK